MSTRKRSREARSTLRFVYQTAERIKASPTLNEADRQFVLLLLDKLGREEDLHGLFFEFTHQQTGGENSGTSRRTKNNTDVEKAVTAYRELTKDDPLRKCTKADLEDTAGLRRGRLKEVRWKRIKAAACAK